MEFIPINICCTLFDDFLVMIVKHDNTELKAVRYSAFKNTQNIQKMAEVTQVNFYFLRTFQSNIKMRTGIWIFTMLIKLRVQ